MHMCSTAVLSRCHHDRMLLPVRPGSAASTQGPEWRFVVPLPVEGPGIPFGYLPAASAASVRVSAWSLRVLVRLGGLQVLRNGYGT